MAPELLRRIAHSHKEVSLETDQVLRQAADQIEVLTRDLHNLRIDFKKLQDECNSYDYTKPSDLRATQKALGDLHKRFGILPGVSTGTLGGDLRAQSERLLKYCADEALISAAGIKLKLQDITRALP